jgi:undecaprenyl-diphosphatase
MDFLGAIILGIVEGVSEFLPVSSTGHMILTAQFLNIPQTEFVKSFEIAIQLGAILAVVVLYFKRLIVSFELIKKIVAAFVPTAVVGLILYKFIKHYLLGNSTIVLWSLLVGGIFLIIFEIIHKEEAGACADAAKMTYRQAIIIGLVQSVAVIPGVSRSAATIIGGLALGLKRTAVAEFSFLLAIPTMLAATVLDLAKSGVNFNADQFILLLIGFVVSFIVALVVVKWLIGYVKNHNFIPFGVYRVILALFLLIFAGRFK